MLSALVLAVLLTADTPTVRPQSTDPFRLVVDPRTQNVEVQNDSALYLSVEIRALRSGQVLVPHVTNPLLFETAKNFVGPQYGLSLFGWSNDVAFAEPRGKNATVTILSGGSANPYHLRLTAREQSIAYGLFRRTYIDECVIPFLVSALGSVDFDAKKATLLRNGIAAMLSQNRQLAEDVYGAVKQGDVGAALAGTAKLVMRDFESGGPLLQSAVLVFGEDVAQRFAARIARSELQSLLTSWHPALKAVDILLKLWNWGPTIYIAAQFVHDLSAYPEKVVYHVYFRPGAGDFSPKAVRTNGEDVEFTILGHKLRDTQRPPVFVLKDRNENVVFRGAVTSVAPDGESMKVKVGGSILRDKSDFLTAAVDLDGKTIPLPDRILLTNVLRLIRIHPSAARTGQQITVEAETVYPFTFANTVYFCRKDGSERTRAKPIVAGRRHLVVEVPHLPGGSAEWRIGVEESRPGHRAESNVLPFHLLPGTYEQFEKDQVAGLMPEKTFTIEGVLSAKNPEDHPWFMVPGGMQVRLELDSVYGPDGDVTNFRLSGWGLRILGANAAGTPVRKTIYYTHRSPSSTSVHLSVQHTTNGSHPFNRYYAEIARKSGKEIHYKFTVTLKRKPDAGGADAGDDADHAKTLDANATVDGYLYGDPHRYREDRDDWYRIPDVPKDEEIRITVSHLDKEGSVPPAFKSVTLFRVLPSGSLEKVGQGRTNLGESGGAVHLRHVEAAERDYLLHIEHAKGLIEYRIRTRIGHVAGPSLALSPVVSDFDQGTNDNWTVIGNYEVRPQPAAHVGNAGTNGYITSRDREKAQTGPLDVVFVIDTTGSMGGAMKNVKDSAAKIIQALASRSPSLRVGLVSYKDHEADAASAVSSQPLTADVLSSLRSLGGWSASGGGGDGPEDVLLGLDTALDLDWRHREAPSRDVASVVVLIGDQPPKLQGDKDFAGRTVSSVIRKANAADIDIYAIGIGDDAGMHSQFRAIANGTRGQVFFVADASKVAQSILGLAQSAVDRHSPRYFVAPRKFLGDMSRFYGRCLSFLEKAQLATQRIDGPDVVLEGGGKTLELFSLMHFQGEKASVLDPFEKFVIRLDASSYFTVKRTGARATKEDVAQVLGDLRALEIRGEYAVGQDESRLDEVKLGVVDVVTDRGFSEDWVRILASLEKYTASLSRTTALMRKLYHDPVANVTNAYNHAGNISNVTLRAFADSGNLSRLVDDIGASSVIGAVYRREVHTLRQNIRTYRAEGALSSREWHAFLAQARAWGKRHERVLAIAKDYLATLVVRAQADTRAFSGHATVQQVQAAFRLKNAADAKLRSLEREMTEIKNSKAIFTAAK